MGFVFWSLWHLVNLHSQWDRMPTSATAIAHEKQCLRNHPKSKHIKICSRSNLNILTTSGGSSSFFAQVTKVTGTKALAKILNEYTAKDNSEKWVTEGWLEWCSHQIHSKFSFRWRGSSINMHWEISSHQCVESGDPETFQSRPTYLSLILMPS